MWKTDITMKDWFTVHLWYGSPLSSGCTYSFGEQPIYVMFTVTQWVPVLPGVWVYDTCDTDAEFFVVKFAGIGWCLWCVYVSPGVQYMWYWWWVLFFLQVPDPNKTVEYKKGYVMRKSCMEPGRRKSQLHCILLFLVCVIRGSGGKYFSFLVFTSNQM